MGTVDPAALDRTLEDSGAAGRGAGTARERPRRGHELLVLTLAAAVFLGTAFSPPSLMDDVDAVQAQIARNMLESGDWVTARLNGIVYLEKAPLTYWTMAVSYAIFGVHDWAARLPFALAAILLCWTVYRFGVWAFSERAGFYAGLAITTSIGLFLFTRILIPDAMVTLTITLALWGMLRALDDGERRPRAWAAVAAASIGAGLLLKGLIAVLFPVGIGCVYLAWTRQLLQRRTWQRLHPISGALIALAIAVPWHVLATVRNPPYFDSSLSSGPGRYRGFLWFYFINEHLLRFLNTRYPRDYNTVPRLQFWLLHMVWFFPWSLFAPRAARLSVAGSRKSTVYTLALIWAALVLVFFTLSTTQEYYSMPAYPAFALLLGCAMAGGESRFARAAVRAGGTIAGVAAIVICAILIAVRGVPAPGDISRALTDNPEAYTLSLGHMQDLTLAAFAYLKLPLAVAGAAFAIGCCAAFFLSYRRALVAFAFMLVLFFHAARLAMAVFEPYLGSREIAETLARSAAGTLIVDDQYYAFSSVFFYANPRSALLLNGRVNNLEYGSNAPGAPAVFISDADLVGLWSSSARYYLVAETKALARIRAAIPGAPMKTIFERGGKVLLSNH